MTRFWSCLFPTVAIFAPLVCAHAQAERPSAALQTALVGGRVIDGTGAPPLSACTVLLRGDRIVAVGPDLAIPDGFATVDVAGKCIVLGLIDMHGHLYANNGREIRNQFQAYPLLYLAGGVTTVFSPGDFDPEGTVAFREKVKRGEAIGPRVLTAGPYFDHRPSKIGWINGVQSSEEACEVFGAWKDRIDGVKVYTSIEEKELVELIRVAHGAGLRVVGHLESVAATRAIELGIDGLEHGIFAMSELARLDETGFPTTSYFKALASVELNGPQMKALIATIVERGVVIDPTTVTMQSLLPDCEAVAPDWKEYAAPSVAKSYEEFVSAIREMEKQQGPEWLEAAHGALRKQAQFVKAVHDRGGVIVAGTDPVAIDLLPGYGMHRELRNFVDAGLTPLEAIQASTQHAARALRREKDFGTIEPGKFADLVVTAGDPARKIEDIGRIEFVIAAGVRYDPEHLRRLAEKSIQ